MQMVVQPVPAGALIFDCLQPLSKSQYQAMAKAMWQGKDFFGKPRGYRSFSGVVRYHDNFTEQELEDSLSTGFGVMLVGVAREDSMKSPSSILGARDGLRAATNVRKLKVPDGFDLWLDVEGTPTATKAQIIEYVNAWAHVVNVSWRGGMYDGWGDSLSAAELYADLIVKGYWAASPFTTAPATRGFRLKQLVEDVDIGVGFKTDIDEHQPDELGDCCQWLKAA